MDFLQNKFFLIALTFGFYLGAQLLQKRTGIKLLNPVHVFWAARDHDYQRRIYGG